MNVNPDDPSTPATASGRMGTYHTDLGAGIEGLAARDRELLRPGSGQVLVPARASAQRQPEVW